MKIPIDKIVVTERIRKEITRIDELAASIQERGLINPITVMEVGGGEFRLLAGLRRLRAVQTLGWAEVAVNVLTPVDAEEVLRIEISENEQREQFTSAEKLDYGRQLGRLESAKALERQRAGVKPTEPDLRIARSEGRARDIVGEAVGLSGAQYDRLKYIGEKAPPETVDETLGAIDRKEKSIYRAYRDLRDQEKAAAQPAPDVPIHATLPVDTRHPATATTKPQHEPPKSKFSEHPLTGRSSRYAGLSKQDEEAIQRLREFSAMSPEEKSRICRVS